MLLITSLTLNLGLMTKNFMKKISTNFQINDIINLSSTNNLGYNWMSFVV